MTDTDLLPCPFCGSTASVMQTTLVPVPERFGESWDVYCESSDSCEASMRDYNTRSHAIEAWNRRTPHPDTALLDAVERGRWSVVSSWWSVVSSRAPSWLVAGFADPIGWFKCEAPTLRAAIEHAIEETTK